MPSEKIGDQVTHGFYTEVSWRRMPGLDSDDQGTSPGHVQLATVNVHSPFEFPEKDTGDHFEAAEKFDGWRVTLDEEGIDRLIRTLHKAKRQAFGSQAAISSGMPGECSVVITPTATTASKESLAALADEITRAVRRT